MLEVIQGDGMDAEQTGRLKEAVETLKLDVKDIKGKVETVPLLISNMGGLSTQLNKMSKSVDELTGVLQNVKGGMRVVLALAPIGGFIGGAIITKLLAFFH